MYFILMISDGMPQGSSKLSDKKNLPFGRLFAVWTGLEPATPCVTGTYSNQLNYQTFSVGAANVYLFNSSQNRKSTL